MNKIDQTIAVLIKKYKQELTLRDGGVTAQKTLKRIKKLATPQQYTRLLEETRSI